MRVERIEVVGFGCLRHRELVFAPGQANLILAPNEAGKSTLLSAIETTLYGFPPARTQEGRDLRHHFRPWSGGASRVTLDLRAGEDRYRVEYEFLDASGEPVEQTTVHRNNQDMTDAMRGEADSPGKWLLGLGRDDFRRSVLVRQGEVELVAQQTGRLVELLDSIATSTQAGASATAARERLTAAVEDYRALAGLDHWSQSYLSQAKQWPRVERNLQQRIDAFQREEQQLVQRREELAQDIGALDQQQTRLAALRRARECLRVLEKAVQRRQVKKRLDNDDAVIRQIGELQSRIDQHDDVSDFPTERVTELSRLLERQTQAQKQLDDVSARRSQLEREARETDDRRAQLAQVSVLAERVDEMRSQLTLFRQAVADQRDADNRRTAAIKELDNAGYPLQRLQEAYARYTALTPEQRQMVNDFQRRALELDQQQREHEQTRREVGQQIDDIEARRRARRRRGLALLGSALAVALIACGLLAWAWGTSAALPVAAAGGLLVVLGGGCGAWLAASAAQLDAYRHEKLRDQISAAEEKQAQLDDTRRRAHDRLDELAARYDSSAAELIEVVQFYLAHHDKLDAHNRAETQVGDAREKVRAYQRRWAEWLRDAGQERAADQVTTEAADALLEKVRQFNDLCEKISSLRRRCQELARDADRLRGDVREAQESTAALLKQARIDLPLPSESNGLAAVEELVVARREFERRAQRHEERNRLCARRDALGEQRLAQQERVEQERRVSRLEEELRDASTDAGCPEEALGQLRSLFDAEENVPFEHWTLETLPGEEVDGARDRVNSEIDELQGVQTRTWQEARRFLREYNDRMPAIDGELRRLRAELRRGQVFAEAIEVARETLEAVQGDSYERWSQLLTKRLEPLLAEFLPDYGLEAIDSSLSPVLVHKPSSQRLEMDGIILHLSRGAKDRLFLALRLALAQVLGEETGVRLPLLLDDPLANWDDQALADGLQALGRLGQQDDASIIIFTCQRSRCEHITPAAGGIEGMIAVSDLR